MNTKPWLLLTGFCVLFVARVHAPTHRLLSALAVRAQAIAPLAIGRGWYSPRTAKNWLPHVSFDTHVRPMWSGVFL